MPSRKESTTAAIGTGDELWHFWCLLRDTADLEDWLRSAHAQESGRLGEVATEGPGGVRLSRLTLSCRDGRTLSLLVADVKNKLGS